MKAIIKNGVANKDIQSCLISECGVEITFHNNDLADKFALSLNLSGIPCVNNRNKITISYIDQLSVSSASYIAEHKWFQFSMTIRRDGQWLLYTC